MYTKKYIFLKLIFQKFIKMGRKFFEMYQLKNIYCYVRYDIIKTSKKKKLDISKTNYQ